jgi:hypothetical protein
LVRSESLPKRRFSNFVDGRDETAKPPAAAGV